MSSLVARFGLEYSARKNLEHTLLANILETFSFDDDLPITSYTRTLTPSNSQDSRDSFIIANIVEFVSLQASDPLSLAIQDSNNNISTVTMNRLFTLVGEDVQGLTITNLNPDKSVVLKVVYA